MFMQLNILIIDPLVKITEVIRQNFDKNFGASIQAIHTLEEGLAFFDKTPSIDLYIIRNYNGLDQNTGRMVEFAKPLLAKKQMSALKQHCSLVQQQKKMVCFCMQLKKLLITTPKKRK